MREVLQLKEEDESLCVALAMDSYYVSSAVLPSHAQMDALKKHIADMKSLQMKRFAAFCEAKSAIVELLEPVSYTHLTLPTTPYV